VPIPSKWKKVYCPAWSNLARYVKSRYNKVIVVIRQHGPTFSTAHGGIQYVCGGGFP
jgi:hypothetical protein